MSLSPSCVPTLFNDSILNELDLPDLPNLPMPAKPLLKPIGYEGAEIVQLLDYGLRISDRCIRRSSPKANVIVAQPRVFIPVLYASGQVPVYRVSEI